MRLTAQAFFHHLSVTGDSLDKFDISCLMFVMAPVRFTMMFMAVLMSPSAMAARVSNVVSMIVDMAVAMHWPITIVVNILPRGSSHS